MVCVIAGEECKVTASHVVCVIAGKECKVFPAMWSRPVSSDPVKKGKKFGIKTVDQKRLISWNTEAPEVSD